MKRLVMITLAIVLLFGISSTDVYAGAPENAFVNFGVPGTGGATNHKFVPEEIKISAGGIVNFAIVSGVGPGSTGGGGFHQLAVYEVDEDTELDEIADQIFEDEDYDIFGWEACSSPIWRCGRRPLTSSRSKDSRSGHARSSDFFYGFGSP